MVKTATNQCCWAIRSSRVLGWDVRRNRVSWAWTDRQVPICQLNHFWTSCSWFQVCSPPASVWTLRPLLVGQELSISTVLNCMASIWSLLEDSYYLFKSQVKEVTWHLVYKHIYSATFYWQPLLMLKVILFWSLFTHR